MDKLELPSRHGPIRAQGRFAITALVVIVLIVVGAGTVSIPNVASWLTLWWTSS